MLARCFRESLLSLSTDGEASGGQFLGQLEGWLFVLGNISSFLSCVELNVAV